MSKPTLTDKDEELISVGASVSAGCLRCCNDHFKAVMEEGATVEEVANAVAAATCVITDAAEIMQRRAYSLMRVKRDDVPEHCTETLGRMTLLVKIAAAVASNCTTTIKKYIEMAESDGIDPDEITAAIRLAQKILKRAGEFADEAIVELLPMTRDRIRELQSLRSSGTLTSWRWS